MCVASGRTPWFPGACWWRGSLDEVWGVICGELALWIEVARGEVELCVIIDVAKVGC